MLQVFGQDVSNWYSRNRTSFYLLYSSPHSFAKCHYITAINYIISLLLAVSIDCFHNVLKCISEALLSSSKGKINEDKQSA